MRGRGRRPRYDAVEEAFIVRSGDDGSSVEIDFRSYPIGKNVNVTVQALKGGLPIATLRGAFAVTGTCVAATLSKGVVSKGSQRISFVFSTFP
jgi:hypothetical protein